MRVDYVPDTKNRRDACGSALQVPRARSDRPGRPGTSSQRLLRPSVDARAGVAGRRARGPARRISTGRVLPLPAAACSDDHGRLSGQHQVGGAGTLYCAQHPRRNAWPRDRPSQLWKQGARKRKVEG